MALVLSIGGLRMSYCRWSTEDFLCDLYIYEHYQGFWAIHVKARRRVYHKPLPPEDPRPFPENGTRGQQRRWVRRLMARQRLVDRWPKHHKPIGGPHDGETFHEPTIAAAIARCESLRAAGYRFPDHVLEDLRDEAAEEGDEDDHGN